MKTPRHLPGDIYRNLPIERVVSPWLTMPLAAIAAETAIKENKTWIKPHSSITAENVPACYVGSAHSIHL